MNDLTATASYSIINHVRTHSVAVHLCWFIFGPKKLLHLLLSPFLIDRQLFLDTPKSSFFDSFVFLFDILVLELPKFNN